MSKYQKSGQIIKGGSRGQASAKRARARRAASMARRRAEDVAQIIMNTRTGGFLGLESKFYDTWRTTATIASANGMTGGEVDPTVTLCLSAPSQGDGQNQREGRQMTLQSVYLTGNLIIPEVDAGTGPSTMPKVFVALVLDKQTNGTQLSSESVYINPSGDDQLIGNPLRNLEFSKRFQVLAVHKCVMNRQTLTWDGTNFASDAYITEFELSKSFKDLVVSFNSASAGVSGVVDNSLHLVAFSTVTGVLLSYNSRIRFMG